MNLLSEIGHKVLKTFSSNVRDQINGTSPEPEASSETRTQPSPSVSRPSSRNVHALPSSMPKTDAQVKVGILDRLLEGTFDQGILIEDDEDDVCEEFPAQQTKTTTDSFVKRPSADISENRTKRTSRHRASSEEQRLLGGKQTRPKDAVIINIPTNTPEMSFKTARSSFAVPRTSRGGLLKPMNTLNETTGSRNEHYHNKTRSNQITVPKAPPDRPTASLSHHRAHHNSPRSPAQRDQTPPYKKRKLDGSSNGVNSTTSVPSETRTEKHNGRHVDDASSQQTLREKYGMDDLPPSIIAISPDSVGGSPSRSMQSQNTTANENGRYAVEFGSPHSLMRPGDDFLEKAAAQRRSRQYGSDDDLIPQQDPDQLFTASTHARPSKPDGSSESRTPKHRPLSAPTHTPKMVRRLQDQSPDALQEGFGSIRRNTRKPLASLSPPDMTMIPQKSYKLRQFVCLGWPDIEAYELVVFEFKKAIAVKYHEPLLTEEALAEIPVAKIKHMTLCNDEKVNIVYLQLSMSVLPGNKCFLEFESLKALTEFNALLQDLNSSIKVRSKSGNWMEKAMSHPHVNTADVAADRLEKAQKPMPERTRRDSGHTTPRDQQHQQKRIRKIDGLDAPPAEKDTRDTQSPYFSEPHEQASRHRRQSSRSRPTRSSGLSGLQGMTTNQEEHFHDEDTAEPVSLDVRRQGKNWKKPLGYPQNGKKQVYVSWDDLGRLEDDVYLNDILIEFFLRYLQENANQDQVKRMHFFSTFFYETLMRSVDRGNSRRQINYDGVSSWTKKVNLFGRDYVIVPVNESYHWYVMLICNLRSLKDEAQPTKAEDTIDVDADTGSNAANTEGLSSVLLESDIVQLDEVEQNSCISPMIAKGTGKRIRGRGFHSKHGLRKYKTNQPVVITLDSLNTPHSSTASALKDYLVREGKEKHGLDFSKEDILGMTAKHIPLQGNWSDCGLYLCLYLEQFMCDPDTFVTSILQRDTDLLKWPQKLHSTTLRQRLYTMLQTLHGVQESEHTEEIAPIGKILIRDEDYSSSKRKSQSHEMYAPENVQEGVDWYEKHIAEGRDRKPADAELLGALFPDARRQEDLQDGHDSDQIVSIRRHRPDIGVPVVIEDDQESQDLAQEMVESHHFSRLDQTPQALAARLRQARSPAKSGAATSTAINVSTPNLVEQERHKRGESIELLRSPQMFHTKATPTRIEIPRRARSVSDTSGLTNFLTGDQSYDINDGDLGHHEVQFDGFDDVRDISSLNMRQGSVVPESVYSDQAERPDPMLLD